MQADVDENERRPTHPPLVSAEAACRQERDMGPCMAGKLYARSLRSDLRRNRQEEDLLEPPMFGIATQAVYAGVIGSFLYGSPAAVL